MLRSALQACRIAHTQHTLHPAHPKPHTPQAPHPAHPMQPTPCSRQATPPMQPTPCSRQATPSRKARPSGQSGRAHNHRAEQGAKQNEHQTPRKAPHGALIPPPYAEQAPPINAKQKARQASTSPHFKPHPPAIKATLSPKAVQPFKKQPAIKRTLKNLGVIAPPRKADTIPHPAPIKAE